MERYDESYAIYEELLSEAVENADPLFELLCRLGIGKIFMDTGQLEKVEDYLLRALALSRNTSTYKTTEVYGTLVEYYTLSNNLTQAQIYVDEGLNNPLVNENLENRMDFYYTISDYYEKAGDDSNALTFQKLYQTDADSIYALKNIC